MEPNSPTEPSATPSADDLQAKLNEIQRILGVESEAELWRKLYREAGSRRRVYLPTRDRERIAHIDACNPEGLTLSEILHPDSDPDIDSLHPLFTEPLPP